MRAMVAKRVVLIGMVFAAMAVQGCKKDTKSVQRQPVVRSLPLKLEEPDFAVAPAPVEDLDLSTPKARQTVGGQPPAPASVQPLEAQTTNVPDAAMVAAIQREQDAILLQQQEAESQRQQQELDQEIQQNLLMQQQAEAEPWVHDAPETMPTEPIPEGPPPIRTQPVPEQ